MAIHMSRVMMSALGELRIHPIDKWVRATLGDQTVVSSTRARIVWEPRRVVASYAVPVADIVGRLVPSSGDVGRENAVSMGSGPPVLDPRTAFTVHTCPGTALTIVTDQGELPGAAFEPDDLDMAGYVVLDWEAFTQWFEETEPVMGHPHDPFDRIDCLRSARHVVVSVDGQVLADTTRATLLFETPLPMRLYLPREDVRMDLLTPAETHSICAYKGIASYWSATVGDRTLPDIAWTYEEPLHDAAAVRGMVSFYTEKVDLVIDGVEIPRPVTPWS